MRLAFRTILCWVAGFAVSVSACDHTLSAGKSDAGTGQDAGKDAAPPDASAPRDAATRDEDSGPDGSAADGGMPAPAIAPRKKAGCRLFGPVFAADRSWALGRCDDRLGKLSLPDLQFDGHASSTDMLIEAVLAKDHVLYIEQYSLFNMDLADGNVRLVALDVYGILTLTPDTRHAVVEGKDDHAGYFSMVFDVTSNGSAVPLTEPGSKYIFKTLSGDGSRVFLRSAEIGKPASVKSFPITGGAATELGDASLSADAMAFAVLDQGTGSITVSFVDGSAPITWHEPGYMPTRIVSFTRDASALILDGPDGTRAVSLDGGSGVHMASVPVPPLPTDLGMAMQAQPASRIGSHALFRWCNGACTGDTGHFNLVPIDGSPAQSREIDNCTTLSITAQFSESGDQAVFLDRQQEIVLADARAATLTVALKDVGHPCYPAPASFGISKDGSKVFATGNFGLRIADAKGKLLGSFPRAGPPTFSPRTGRMSVLVGDELQIIELASSEVLYRVTLAGYAQDTFGWIDDDRFIYDDANTVYLVQLTAAP